MTPVEVMIIFLLSMALVCIIALISCWYLLVRNNWVYTHRTKILNMGDMGDMTEYDNLLSYKEMMNKFWVWDIEKLKRR